jgi:la-related protein 1
MNLPPVGDASFWPTPQVAQGEEIRKAQEKTEKTDKTEKGDKSPATRPHGKEKWMPVPYVPTAVFNTPLPSAGRRGGRAARGGRDGGRSGAYGAGDQGPAGKQSASADRARNEANTARANSLPAQSRRSNSADAAKSGDPRKNPPPADRSRGVKGAEDAAAGKENVRPQRDGKPFPRNQEFGAHKGADNNRNPRLNIDSQSGPRAGTPHDRRFENGPKSADVAGFNGERDNKENHFRESRGRGRGRGGGHAGYPGSQNHFVNHMPPFSHAKFGFNDRQRSHGLPNGSHQGHKMNIRSPSLPNSASMYGVYPFPADVNTMYGYPAVPAGPMSAMPYQNYMEPFSLMSMISMQL